MKLDALVLAAPCVRGVAFARRPNDAQIAHIVGHREPGRHRRRQARRVEGLAMRTVKAFGKQMVTDHTGVNQQAVALAKKLSVNAPQDNATSQSSKAGGADNVKKLTA
jgi:putative membrane protein